MKDGFIKVAACTPEIQVADVDFNVDKIISQLEKCREEGVKVAVFPELCITGYTCQDLFFQNALLDKAMEGVVKIAKTTADSDMLVAVGVPVRANGVPLYLKRICRTITNFMRQDILHHTEANVLPLI